MRSDKLILGLLACILAFVSYSCKKTNSRTTKPNIVFIMSDDHAIKAISAYGSDLIETPNIDRIADRGLRFHNAFVTNSICAPSRAVILTGKYSHLNGVMGNEEVFDGTQETIPKILQGHGYQTALIGKWHLKSAPTGFDYWNVLPGQGDYYNPDFIKQGKDTVYQGYVTDIITELSLEWLKNRKDDQPFYLMMHHKAPHRSWMPALKNLAKFDDRTFEMPDNFYDDYKGREALQRQMLTVINHMDIRMDFKVPCETCDTADVNWWAPEEYSRRLDRLTVDERERWKNAYQKEQAEYNSIRDDEKKLNQWKFQRYMEDYLRSIISVDESVGNLLDYLKNNHLEENTLVIYTSDQGFFLGEHGLFDKRFMYEEAFKTPLLIKYPNEINRSGVRSQLVQNIDIPSTILDVAGIEIPKELQGKSLRPIWQENKAEWREALYYHYYEKGFGATPHYGIRTNRYKLIHFYKGLDSWEFYDLTIDPTEMHNQINNTDYKAQIETLKNKLSELQEHYKDPITQASIEVEK